MKRQIPNLLPALLAIVTGCGGCGLEIDLERMIDQPRYDAYEACRVFDNGTIMQNPPEGTVPRGSQILPPSVELGVGNGGWVRDIPIEIDGQLLHRGRSRFEIFCAACHGVLGDGETQVAENMTLRPPPNLLEPPYVGYPAGRVYAAITYGFGLMRSYEGLIQDVRDRWAVVAYLEVLQLSQGVELERLPGDLAEEAQRRLR